MQDKCFKEDNAHSNDSSKKHTYIWLSNSNFVSHRWCTSQQHTLTLCCSSCFAAVSVYQEHLMGSSSISHQTSTNLRSPRYCPCRPTCLKTCFWPPQWKAAAEDKLSTSGMCLVFLRKSLTERLQAALMRFEKSLSEPASMQRVL